MWPHSLRVQTIRLHRIIPSSSLGGAIYFLYCINSKVTSFSKFYKARFYTTRYDKMGIKEILLAGTVALASVALPLTAKAQKINYLKPDSITSSLGYKPVFSEPSFYGVQLAERCDSGTGRIQRTERWKPIIQAAEQKYGVPRNTLYSMVMEESCGDPLQPNAKADGGLGLTHVQPKTAEWMGLDIYGRAGARFKDPKNGEKVKDIIGFCRRNVNCLLEYDERAHPIKNLDMAGRYLAHYKQSKGTWDEAVMKFGPQKHKQRYLSRINKWKNALRQKRDSAIADFNKRNAGKMINGRPLTFDLYIKSFNEMNKNYGLEEYRKTK